MFTSAQTKGNIDQPSKQLQQLLLALMNKMSKSIYLVNSNC